MNNKKNFLNLWLIIGLISGFSTIVFFVTAYLNNEILCTLDCKYKNQVLLAIILVALTGLFVGTLTYYFINEKLSEEKEYISKQKHNLNSTLLFLEPDERKIIQFLLNNKGVVSQSKLSKNLNMNRVKVSRLINSLQKRDIVFKTKAGMTNTIQLKKELKDLFLGEQK